MSGKQRDTGHLGALVRTWAWRPQRWNQALSLAPWEAKGQWNKRREGQSPPLFRPESGSTPLPLALVLGPSSNLISPQETMTLLGLPFHILALPGQREMLPGTQQFPRLLPVEEVLKGEAWPPSLHLLPCPSPTAGQGELLPPPASLGSSCLHYLSPQRPELDQLHKAQAAENLPQGP